MCHLGLLLGKFLLCIAKYVMRSINCRVNANLDMIVSACELLIALNATPTEPADHPVLKSVVQLEQLVSFSMQKCAGVERTFSDPDLFDIITKISASLPHSVRSILG